MQGVLLSLCHLSYRAGVHDVIQCGTDVAFVCRPGSCMVGCCLSTALLQRCYASAVLLHDITP